MNDPESPLDSATRVLAGDDGTNYDNVAVTLHWLTALLVIVQFLPAVTWDWYARSTRQSLESVHISLGVLLTAVIVARLIWRWIPGHQRPAIVSGWPKIASKAVHYLLYLMLVVQAGLGFAFRWGQGHPVEFFGLFGIPGPFDRVEKPIRHTLHFLHEWLGWGIIILALVHAAAALYHHYVLKDRVLQRMLPKARQPD